MRRKGLVKHPDLKMEQAVALDGLAMHNQLMDTNTILSERNRRWIMIYHHYGYTQAEIARLYNSQIPPDSPARLSEDAVEKAISRSSMSAAAAS